MANVYKTLDQAVDSIKQGGVGVIPTDTLYGLVASAKNREAVARIYQIKQRDNKPGTLIASEFSQLTDIGLKLRYLTAVEQFWPGAVSILIPCFDLDYLHYGLGSVPVRIPDDSKLTAFLNKTGALQTSSANIAGEPCATTLEEAQAYFGESVDFYVDGGDLSGRKPSTIIRIVDDAVEVIRKGAVEIDETGRISK